MPASLSRPMLPRSFLPLCRLSHRLQLGRSVASTLTSDDLTTSNRKVWSSLPEANVVTDLDGIEAVPSSKHWRAHKEAHSGAIDVTMPHPVWTEEEMNSVQIEHTKPNDYVDKAAYSIVMLLRSAYDLLTGYSLGLKSEAIMIKRIVVLETVAGVPGLVGAAYRHLRSLRKIKPDYGWIHTLLEEAENERMHLMTAMLMHKPSRIIRGVVHIAQTLFLAWYSLMYSISPRFCHRFVGYLEEEAVKTYTGIIELIDKGKLPGFSTGECPKASQKYWGLGPKSSIRDLMLAIRADEAHHREVNHTFANLPSNAVNPFPPGY